ncbi:MULTISPECIES: hypothetical protein [unclassified Clostridioides]|uniref:hypothetical protein n=1 Tax=unclassified Clostridioides TaxID=2635829 RepID=UPI001D0C1655|nr:hypothetical protein [Clostridioides sp. ES-S-0190-01]MCC0763628.1 hypothetical protein [Clostridioides sp. ES-S-0006-03]
MYELCQPVAKKNPKYTVYVELVENDCLFGSHFVAKVHFITVGNINYNIFYQV